MYCMCVHAGQCVLNSAAGLTRSEWGWTQCCDCGPWCPESSCSAAYTPSCSLWSRPGAGRRGSKDGRRKGEIEVKKEEGRGEKNSRDGGDDKDNRLIDQNGIKDRNKKKKE